MMTATEIQETLASPGSFPVLKLTFVFFVFILFCCAIRGALGGWAGFHLTGVADKTGTPTAGWQSAPKSWSSRYLLLGDFVKSTWYMAPLGDLIVFCSASSVHLRPRPELTWAPTRHQVHQHHSEQLLLQHGRTLQPEFCYTWHLHISCKVTINLPALYSCFIVCFLSLPHTTQCNRIRIWPVRIQRIWISLPGTKRSRQSSLDDVTKCSGRRWAHSRPSAPTSCSLATRSTCSHPSSPPLFISWGTSMLCFQSAVSLPWSVQTLPCLLPSFAARIRSPLKEDT